MLAHFIINLIFIPAATCASGWEEIANNLSTDLAPILQLFGEQVTKQYLAESTSWLDCVIFAMAPLGILTAIVSMIRICGSPQLRAFVGRSQEGSGVAEIELCSSTGKDLAELYQRGAIVRVFGRAKILEFAYVKHLDNPESDSLVPSTMGLTTLSEYLHDQPADESQLVWDMSKQDDDNEKSELITNPSLRLNIGFRRPPKWVLICFVCFSILLQTSMLGFAIWATYSQSMAKTSSPANPWGLPMTISGTLLLCLGMFSCSFMIKNSTKEITWTKRKPFTFPWGQPVPSDADFIYVI
ncbi:hypothetical protein NX059_011117 [Plenodomus lindquistii]|nr:hypothetical protein NX059_011117 [Plenodomus lindquistii]